jgi:hypothetical protein
LFPLAERVYLGYNLRRFGRIDQLVRAPLSHNGDIGTKAKRGLVVQLVRTRRSHRRGHRFESCQDHKILNCLLLHQESSFLFKLAGVAKGYDWDSQDAIVSQQRSFPSVATVEAPSNSNTKDPRKNLRSQNPAIINLHNQLFSVRLSVIEGLLPNRRQMHFNSPPWRLHGAQPLNDSLYHPGWLIRDHFFELNAVESTNMKICIPASVPNQSLPERR